ncbi:unnamed protein product [Candidula unifasciata]|uniref:Uncharacterized protein n=1 Tax=Candidula unifasciata TaxID=100452 RepID=A0A8S3ZFA9_9EUPU|nr:unnamed protein product [Candidula unifasciata]
MKLLVLLLICAILMTCQCQFEELPMYKACLMECYRCVKTYGKLLYNGKVCAENCAVTNGQSLDSKCDRPTKRTGRKSPPTAACAHLCSNQCGPGYSNDNMDTHACIFTCIISNEQTVAC